MGVLGVKKRSSETGHPRRSMKARMSAGWGYPTESSGLPCGKVGVTAWKFRGYPVENSALPQALAVATLLAYVLPLFDSYRRNSRDGFGGKGASCAGRPAIGVIRWRRPRR